MIKNTLASNDRAYARQDEFFTPRMAAADQQLRVLAERIGARYDAGAIQWRSFATPGALQSTADLTASSVWGGASVVRWAAEGCALEVTYGVELLVPHERGLRVPATWAVLVPRVTISVAEPSRPLNRFDASGSSDDEVRDAVGRLLDKAIDAAVAASGRAGQPVPSVVEHPRRALAEIASRISCEEAQVVVTGRPLHRAADETREFGQGDFTVESMVTLIERTIDFVQALEHST